MWIALHRAVQALGDRIASGVAAKGYEVLGRRTAQTGAGIVSFRKPDVDSGAIVHQTQAEAHHRREPERLGADFAAFLCEPGGD